MLAIQHLYQHLTSIFILNDYLGPSSHCDRSGICNTYCLDLLWIYKNSSSLTSPKKSYIICDIFLLGSCAANCHCFLQIIRAKYYDIYIQKFTWGSCVAPSAATSNVGGAAAWGLFDNTLRSHCGQKYFSDLWKYWENIALDWYLASKIGEHTGCPKKCLTDIVWDIL